MASIHYQAKAYLVAKGKSDAEADTILYDMDKVTFNSDLTGDYISRWAVLGITMPSKSELNSFTTEAEAYESLQRVIKNRVKNYPTIEEQMDLQYWDAVNGTTKWKEAIAAVKTNYPKPS